MTPPQVAEKELGKTLNMYRNIAIAMNSFQLKESVSVKDLAKKAQVHWNTAKKALLFFHKIGPLIPKFQLGSNLRFRVEEKPDAMAAVEGVFESKEMKILTQMMLAEATESQKARRFSDTLTEEERSILPSLIDKGYVNSINGRYYLSKRGQSLGSMGIRRIVELNIPLPWEKRLVISTSERISPRPQLGKYVVPPINVPPPINFPWSDARPQNMWLLERSKWTKWAIG